MKRYLTIAVLLLALIIQPQLMQAQDRGEVERAMLEATRFMVEEVSINGGYVRLQTTDLSRRWGELETFPTQIWIGGNYPFTPAMGEVFLRAWQLTGEEYYYEAARKVVDALVWGQLESGGWDYIIDFAGHRSLTHWYETIGANAFGWYEYNNYYGTATQHSNTTAATRFLLRFYTERLEAGYRPALERALNFIIESQFPLGGWPKRWPPGRIHTYDGYPDYTNYYNFHADVPRDNVELLIEAYVTLGQERFLDPIRRGMSIFLTAQLGNPQGGWARHLDMELNPASGRRYEPVSLSIPVTLHHIGTLMRFYEYTGDGRFLARIPDAFEWLESARLPDEMTGGGRYTHPMFVEIGTNRPLFVHRKREGVEEGHGIYWVDYDHRNAIAYGSRTHLDERLEQLRREFEQISSTPPEEVTRQSPLRTGQHSGTEMPQRYESYRDNYKYYDLSRGPAYAIPDPELVRQILSDLDEEGRWLTTGEWISEPYTVDEQGRPSNTAPLSVEFDHTAIVDDSDQSYISTRVYIDNMMRLMRTLEP